MDPLQFEDVANEIQTLHKSMKNVIEIVFATSPLLALSTHGWGSRSFHSTFLLRVSGFLVFSSSLISAKKIFHALGNNRPQILVQLEDHVLQAVVDILDGKSCDNAVDNLYSQILSLEDDLANDHEALEWFNLSKSASSIPFTPPPSEFPSIPSEGLSI
jgi:hypothetical protein